MVQIVSGVLKIEKMFHIIFFFLKYIYSAINNFSYIFIELVLSSTRKRIGTWLSKKYCNFQNNQGQYMYPEQYNSSATDNKQQQRRNTFNEEHRPRLTS